MPALPILLFIVLPAALLFAAGVLIGATMANRLYRMDDPAPTAVIHFGPVWFKRGMGDLFSFAACDADPPNLLTTHLAWVTCEACRKTEAFEDERI